MLGSRNAVGAAIMPGDRAERLPRSPQPSASIQPTRTPMSLLASGHGDGAHREPERREAEERPQRRAPTRCRRRTCRCPVSRSRRRRRRRSRSGTGCRTALTSAPQIQPARPLIDDEQPDGHDHHHDLRPVLDGPDQDPLDPDAADECDHERQHERRPVRQAGCISDHAMYVVNVAISPWAKLTMSVVR